MHLQRTTDFSNPEERFLWALESVPMSESPIHMPEQLKRILSTHLSKAGFIHCSQVPAEVLPPNTAQQIHFQPPTTGVDHSFNALGYWKSVDEPIQEKIRLTEGLSMAQKAQILAELREEGVNAFI